MMLWLNLFFISIKLFFTRRILFNGTDLELLFDSIFIALILIGIYFLFKKKANPFYIGFNVFISTVLLAIIINFNYSGTILTYESVAFMNQVGEIGDSIFSLFHWRYLLLYADIPLLVIITLFKLTNKQLATKYLMILSTALLIVSIFRVVDKRDIINENIQAQRMGIFNYQLYVAYQNTFGKSISSEDITQEHINQIKGITSSEGTTNVYEGIAKDLNIIVVQLEAFQDFTIDLSIDNQEITPVLNKLVQESFYFTNVYQQIGKGNTSDAEFVANTSIYPVGNQAMSKAYGDRAIPSLPRLLKEQGYVTTTFHSNDIKFWDRDQLYQALGFDYMYDKNFFGDIDVIAFGASDEVLYRKSIEELSTFANEDKKFYASVIAMSSHHPYQIPDHKVEIQLPEKYQNTPVGDYLTAVNYADFALGELIEDLKRENLWDNTMLVIYGDHFGLRLEAEQDRELMKDVIGRPYHPYIDHFNIPLIVRVPGQESKQIDLLGGQIDIMPTVANLAGISLDQTIYFGQDLLNTNHNLVGMRYYLPTGSFLNDEVLFVPREGFKDGSATTLESKERLKEITALEGDFYKLLELLQLSDAYVEMLPKRND